MANEIEYEPMADGTPNTMLPSTEAKLRALAAYYQNPKLTTCDAGDVRFVLGKLRERHAEIERLKSLCPPTTQSAAAPQSPPPSS
jgi:hypothetical protein